VRFDELFYPAAFVLLLTWLVFQSTLPQGGGVPKTESLPGPAPATQPAEMLRSSEAPLPQVAATASVNGRDYQILVGWGPPTWGVAVSSDD